MATLEEKDFLKRVIQSNYAQVYDVPNELYEASITGSRRAILPMEIAISDKNNERISFILLVNPENINHGKTNSVYANYTKKGFITQLWGPNQDLLTGTGKTAAFYSGDGLSNFTQRTLAFKNFMSLFSTYRNNGYELLDLANLNNLTRTINVIHGIEIEYDGQFFLGHFNNFTLDEAAETPFILNYNFEFVVSSLSRDYNEIRGHFIPIGEPVRKSSLIAKVKVGESILNEGNEQFNEQFQLGQQKSGKTSGTFNGSTPDTVVEKIAWSIGQVESSGRYYDSKGNPIKGPLVTYKNGTTDYAWGRYQVMGKNVPSWSKEALGYSITVEEFQNNPVLQDKIAQHQMGKAYAKYGTVDDVASVWFSGRPVIKAGDSADVTGTTVPKYVANTRSYYASIVK